MVQLEYKLGPLTVNFRVLLEPKGFLRIIILFVALLAFSLTAGFQSADTSNTVTCAGNATGVPTNYTASINFRYPYDGFSYSLNQPDYNFTQNNTNCAGLGAGYRALSSSAQFFVAVGVVTIIYVLGAILIYMLFITPELYIAKWLVLGDLFGTILFGVLYTIASLAWSVGAAQLDSYLKELLNGYASNCFQCNPADLFYSVSTQPFTQLAISAIFGWLASFIWFSSIWFVYKDTFWHKDEAGPLAPLYARQAAKKEGREYQPEEQREGDKPDTEADQ